MSGSLIYGFHAVLGALEHEPDQLERLYIDRDRKDQRMRELTAAARRAGVAIERVSREALDARVSGGRHQGVIAQAAVAMARGEESLERLLGGLSEAPFLLVLDGVQDPHNLGAVLRTAAAAGVHAVIAPRDRAVGLTAAVRKVASGAAEGVPFVQVTNLARTLQALQRRGLWIVGAAGDSESTLFDADLRGPLALVMGGEGKGLRRLTRQCCDLLVRIPMTDLVESLNVSVAAGICLFEALRQRSA
ncbi:MAG: 23S rRNA (guanosine(2251)-2'-O)-methyltransferase RlmB [Gammaproteobacteria bacterium]